jgi:hypothetical protein
MKELALPAGGTALILETDGERVVLLAPNARPPGSSLLATFGSSNVTIKVRGSQRVEPDADGRCFRIEGRFVSLSRELRLALTS